MALTDAQKAQVRRYLGYPDVNRASYPDLEGALDALSAEGETFVGELLTSLASVQTKLASAWDRQKVHRAEEVTLAGHDEILALRAEGYRLARDLGVALDVKPRRNPFASGSGTHPLG
jgi:hypothetical protein